MAEACGDRPIIITPNLFEGKPYTKADGTNGRFDLAQARAIYNALILRATLSVLSRQTRISRSLS